VSVEICRKFTSNSESKLRRELLDGLGEEEIVPYKEFLLQINGGEEYTKVLMKALDCGEEDLKKILQKNVYWNNFPVKTVVERIEAFQELGVKGSDLIEHSSVLYTDFGNLIHYFINLSFSIHINVLNVC